MEILSLILIAACAWFWFDSLKARESALLAARKACEAEGLQLLDETVAFAGMRPERDGDGRMRLRRVYRFEFSDTGDNRHQGSVAVLGSRVCLINIDPPSRRQEFSRFQAVWNEVQSSRFNE